MMWIFKVKKCHKNPNGEIVIRRIVKYQLKFSTTEKVPSLPPICLSEVKILLNLVPLSLPPRVHTHACTMRRRRRARVLLAQLPTSGAKWQSIPSGLTVVPVSRRGRSNWDRAGVRNLQTDPNQSCAPLALSQNKEMCLAGIQQSWSWLKKKKLKITGWSQENSSGC